MRTSHATSPSGGHRARWIAALALVLVAAACRPAEPLTERPAPSAPIVSQSAVTVQPGAPGTATRTLTTEQAQQLPRPPYTAADVAFMQGMIPHHEQALEMTALVADLTTRREILLLALRIELSQQDEINFMRTWLRQRNEALPPEGEHADHGALMPGMLTIAQMATLAAARGATFDRHFLTFMIQHHEGAVRMVTELFASRGGGQQTAVNQFAADVEADQAMEITRMQKLLDDR